MGIFDQTTTTTNDPYAPAEDDLISALDFNKRVFDRGYYSGEQIAGVNDLQRSSADQILAAAQGYGDLANTQQEYGSNLIGGMNNAQDYWQNMLNSGGPLSSDPNKYIDLAGQFANNPYTQNVIDAATRNMTQNYQNNVMPGTAGAFGMAGAGNSSKYAQQWATQDRELNRDIYGMGQGFLGDQWNQGLNYAVGAANQDANMGMQSAANLNNQGMYGMGLLGQAAVNRMVPGQTGLEMGNLQQNWDQQAIDNARAMWNEPMTFGQNYQAGVMQPAQAFSTQTSTQSKSPLGSAIGIAAQIGAAYMTGGASLAAGGLAGAMGGGGGGGGGYNYQSMPGGGFQATTLPQAQGMNLWR